MNAMIRGAMNGKLYDMLKGENAPEIDADEAMDAVLAEFRRLGGESE